MAVRVNRFMPGMPPPSEEEARRARPEMLQQVLFAFTDAG